MNTGYDKFNGYQSGTSKYGGSKGVNIKWAASWKASLKNRQDWWETFDPEANDELEFFAATGNAKNEDPFRSLQVDPNGSDESMEEWLRRMSQTLRSAFATQMEGMLGDGR